MKTKLCLRCFIGIAKRNERYCWRCRGIVIAEIEEVYLTNTIPSKQPCEQRARSQRYGNAVGGSAELNSDGDEP